MNLLQLYYTSSENGLYGNKGFRTYSMSEGITENERLEIERYGVYIPPHHLPTQPSTEELSKFPIAFSFFQLSSGRYGICCSRYVGKDYSGRYGNYFCHALIAEEDFFPVYPAQLFSLITFKEYLTETEKQTDEPLPLEKLALNIKKESLKNVENSINKHRLFSNILNAILDNPLSNRSLVLVKNEQQDVNDILQWMTTLQMTLPLPIAHKLSFTTYTYEPEQSGLLVNWTLPQGVRFAFSAIQKTHSFYIFDLKNIQQSSQINNSLPVCEFMQNHIDNLYEFHQFIRLFNYGVCDAQLDLIFYLYEFLKEKNKAIISIDKLVMALTFVEQTGFLNKEPAQTVSLHLVERLNSDNVIQHISGMNQLSLENAEFLFGFLFPRSLHSDAYLEATYKTFFAVLDDYAFSLEQGSYHVDNIVSFYHKINKVESIDTQQFTEKYINHVCEISLSTPTIASLYFKIMMETLIDDEIGYVNPIWQTGESLTKLSAFFQACFELLFTTAEHKSALCNNLKRVADKRHELFAELVIFALECKGSTLNKVKACYSNIKKNQTPEWVKNVHTILCKKGQEGFVYSEFSDSIEKLETNKEKVAHFEKNADVHSTSYIPMVKILLEKITNSKEKAIQAEAFLHKQESLFSANTDVCQSFITYIEQELPLYSNLNRRDEKTLKFLTDFKEKYEINTNPNILYFRQLLDEASNSYKDAKDVYDLLTTQESQLSELNSLSNEKYQEFLEGILFVLFPLPGFTHDKALKKILPKFNESNIFDYDNVVSLYVDCFAEHVKHNKKQGVDLLSEFLEFYLNTKFYIPKADVELLLSKQLYAVFKQINFSELVKKPPKTKNFKSKRNNLLKIKHNIKVEKERSWFS